MAFKKKKKKEERRHCAPQREKKREREEEEERRREKGENRSFPNFHNFLFYNLSERIFKSWSYSLGGAPVQY